MIFWGAFVLGQPEFWRDRDIGPRSKLQESARRVRNEEQAESLIPLVAALGP
jgi:hypothetical protein